ncbi:MAG: FecR domain-containing protein [Chloroflexi bacterium]|nr:FecR domain-containing protein [Chloroflexota bacterium]
MLSSEELASSAAIRRREALAWGVIWVSFILFCLLIAGAVLGAFWYRDTAVDSRNASLTVLDGTVLVRRDGEGSWASADPEMVLKKGDSIKTDANAQAFISLFDGSTIRVFSGTELQIKKSWSSRFSSRRQSIVLSQTRGKLQLGVAVSPDGVQRHFALLMPTARMSLSEGSFSAKIDGDMAVLHVRERGNAVMTAAGQTVSLKEGEWSQAGPKQTPSTPMPLQEELVFNGDFAQGTSGWQVLREYGFQEGQGVEGKVERNIDEGRLAMRFTRADSRGTHFGIFLFQEMDRDVSEFSSLKLTLRMKLINQSLPGGGYMGSEYPLMVRIDYRFPGGQSFQDYSLYYQNKDGNRTDTGTKIPQGEWVEYTLPDNLMNLLPKPQHLVGIQVGASGWDFDSEISRIGLTGE